MSYLYRQSVESLNPAAYWPLDEGDLASGETAADVIGGDDLTMSGAGVIASIGPAVTSGGAAKSQGTGQYLRKATPVIAIAPAMTLAGWFWIDDAGTGRRDFVSLYEDDSNLFNLFTVGGNMISVAERSGSTIRRQTVAPPPAGQWTHIVCVYTGLGVFIYFDGKLVSGSASTSGQAFGASAAFTLGASPLGSTHFLGDYDHVAYWTRVLSAKEIAQLYDDGLKASVAGGRVTERTADRSIERSVA